WLKAFHVIAIIAWMAGMLYLPRLFVYHCEAEPGSKQSETFKVMERRLLNAIITPGMVVSWGLGLWLAGKGGLYVPGWLQCKGGGFVCRGVAGGKGGRGRRALRPTRFFCALRARFRRGPQPPFSKVL